MRVLLWSELFWPYVGGAELFAATLMDALGRRGYEFAVVTSQDYLDLPEEERFRGIPIHRFPFRTGLVPQHIDELARLRRRIAALVGDLSPDVIHLNSISPSAFFCLHAARSSRTPLLVRLNTRPLFDRSRPAGTTLIEHIVQSAAWVTAVSTTTLAQVRELVPAIGERSSVIYNGVESPAQPPAPPPQHPPRLLCLGRLVRDKGFDLAVAALPAIVRRWPAAQLVIAGDGPERQALADQAAALGVTAATVFPGWIPPAEVAGLMASATLVILPSRREGLPNVALQAAACGRPVVATRIDSLPEIVVHDETGLLVELDAASLAEAISQLLALPERATSMGAAAWRRARERFGPERCVDAYDALYRTLARQRH